MSYRESLFNVWRVSESGWQLLNTFTQAVAFLDQSAHDAFLHALEGSNPADNPELLSVLVANGFIVDGDADELKILRYRYRQAYYSTEYMFVTLVFTMRCNFRCPYCFEFEKTATIDENGELALRQFSERAFMHRKRIHLSLFGGEPLLEADKMFAYLDHVNQLQDKYNFTYDTSITTNGYLLHESTIDRLVDSYRLRTCQVTIDGCKGTHDSTRALGGVLPTYSVVLHNFRALIRKNKETNGALDPCLRINLLNNKLEEIQSLLDEFAEDEKRHFRLYFRPIYNTQHFCSPNSNRSDLQSFFDLAKRQGFRISVGSELKHHHCEGDSGLNQIQIMPDLSVWKCINDLACERARIGAIDPGGNFRPNVRNLEFWSRNDPFEDPDCVTCKLLPLCWGGCPLIYAKTGQRVCGYEKDVDLFDLLL